MALKIICLEEHCADPAMQSATQPATMQQAPYYGELNSRYEDDPNTPGALPALTAMKGAGRLLGQTPEERIAAMDAAGIDVQVLSYADLIQLASADAAVDLAACANDRLADLVARHRDRFAGFCALPWQRSEAAVRELDRIAKLPGLVGCLLAGHAGEDTLVDDSRFEPILAKLAELRLPLYIHPGPPLPAVQKPYYAGLGEEVSARLSLFGWGLHNEAGIQEVRLILSGALDRHPDLRLISGHWGEMVPFFLQRMDDTMPQGATGLSRTITQTYRDQIYVTPSGMLNLPHFRFIHEVLGPERILFSIDYPFLTMRGARQWLETLGIDEPERAAIAHGNAERLLHLG